MDNKNLKLDAKKYFDDIDSNGDNKIDIDEIDKNHKLLPKPVYDESISACEESPDKKISFDVFYNVYIEYIKLYTPKNIREYFPFGISILSIIQIFIQCIDKQKYFNDLLKYDTCIMNREYWRFLSYGFVHDANSDHLTFNLFTQILLAYPLEISGCPCGALIVYFSASLSGALGHTIFTFLTNEPHSYLLGASAGIFGLMSANVIYIVLNRESFRENIRTFLIQIVLSFIFLVLAFCELSEGSKQIDHASHIFGLIGGMLVGMGVIKNNEKQNWELKVRNIFLVIYIILLITGIIIFVKHQYSNEHKETLNMENSMESFTKNAEDYIQSFNDPEFTKDLTPKVESILVEITTNVKNYPQCDCEPSPSAQELKTTTTTDESITSSPQKYDSVCNVETIQTQIVDGKPEVTQISKKVLKKRISKIYMDRGKAKSVFQRYDTDSDGYLNVEELQALVESEDVERNASTAVAKTLLRTGDKDKNKMLSFDEFYELINSRDDAFKAAVRRYYKIFTDQEPTYEVPKSIIVISLAQIICYWTIANKGYEMESIFKYCTCEFQSFWRLFLYMFIHHDGSVLITNIVIQLLLAFPLEPYHTWWRLILIYFGGGLAGALGHSLLGFKDPLIGASAGVYALVTANIAFVILNWEEMKKQNTFQCLISISMIAIIVVITFSAPVYPISNATSYLFGILAGFLIGMSFMENFDNKDYETSCKSASAIIFCLFVLVSIVFIIVQVLTHFCDDDECLQTSIYNNFSISNGTKSKRST